MIRNLINVCKRISSQQVIKENRKLFHTLKLQTLQNPSKCLIYGGSLAFFSGMYYYLSKNTEIKNVINYTSAICASVLKTQNSVYSQTKKHALYLTIHLHPTASTKEVSKVFCNLEKYVDIVSPKEFRDEDDEIFAGVGFGPDFLNKVKPDRRLPHNFAYHERKGQHGSMPSTGGDIFIHAKSNDISKLFELAQMLLKSLPIGTVDSFEDIYGWVYRNGRDLSGFIDGTENPADEEHRYQVAVNQETGGSFVVTQKWIHNHEVIGSEKDEKLENWIGRKRSDSTELKRKTVTSHVSRMTGGANFAQAKKFEIVRQSQPFGTLSSENGLFFIGYSSRIDALDYMLNRMVGATDDGLSDDVMRITKCVKSTYWYFPGVEELERMAK